MECKIDSDDPENKEGEVLVRGENVMLGYYKNDAATKEALDKDGWLHTGDRGVLDKDGYVFLRGRAKNMILGPSGQNIFPEEVEAILDNLPYVQESLLLEHESKLYALVYPDMEKVGNEKLGSENLEAIMEDNRKVLNGRLPDYIKVQKININEEEFEKTPTKKIKRFNYSIKP